MNDLLFFLAGICVRHGKMHEWLGFAGFCVSNGKIYHYLPIIRMYLCRLAGCDLEVSM